MGDTLVKGWCRPMNDSVPMVKMNCRCSATRQKSLNLDIVNTHTYAKNTDYETLPIPEVSSLLFVFSE